MRTRRKLIGILFGCGIAAILILMLWRGREPSYAGQTLGQWVLRLGAANGPNPAIFYLAAANIQGRTLSGLAQMWKSGASQANPQGATEAIEHIGPRAVPFLIKWTDYHESPWRQRLALLCYKLPKKFSVPAVPWILGHGYERQQGAYSALAILGPKAKAAIPALRRQVESSTQIGDAYLPLMVLRSIGEDGLPAILDVLRNPRNPSRAAAMVVLGRMDPRLVFREDVAATLITCLDDRDRDLALHAGGILCSHKSDQEVVMRIFIAALQANDPHIRNAAMPIRVCLMGGFPVPTLLDLLQDTNSLFSADAAAVLGNRIANDIQLPDTVRPALICALRDPRSAVRQHAATAVGNFGDAAEPAVPALLDAWNDPDPSVRQYATNALFQIPAYAALKDVAVLDNITTEPARTKWIRNYFDNAPGPELARLLEHPDPRIREMATNALQKFSANDSEKHAAQTPTH